MEVKSDSNEETKTENVDVSQSAEENQNADEAVDAKVESESISEDIAESAEPEKGK